jgi:hypothetical protein
MTDDARPQQIEHELDWLPVSVRVVADGFLRIDPALTDLREDLVGGRGSIELSAPGKQPVVGVGEVAGSSGFLGRRSTAP